MTIIPPLDWLQDVDRIEKVVSLLRASGVEELEQSDLEGRRIFLRLRQQDEVATSLNLNNQSVDHTHTLREAISAPYFGALVLASPYEGTRSWGEGDTVDIGDVVAWIAQGNLVIPVRATVSGIIVCVLKEEGELVGYGDDLFEVERRSATA
ncbi:hypothetical protein AA106555_0837 [Neokomagataea thailandica NBRC 106555]|uniref:Acetyl-CoA carboxylase biotin carboxyl carrier protein subunit n=2 Tax=Neokomagataea TaxID=1223423 RepID=A0A4Y6VAE9_9PROT|nr:MULTISPECIES: acetyl-CoA carboxylase biotin carboxyl carrier protein subunit [Neokomagataea]QDH25496.1 acetyl-CoA carboxylase biotin carboxyl carrier protein subunit [Neokomagataea tanensis]GBR52214.1 hypothetical protein AA106555_0837 [Neokomagataea thailandica NBRC 106555]